MMKQRYHSRICDRYTTSDLDEAGMTTAIRRFEEKQKQGKRGGAVCKACITGSKLSDPKGRRASKL